VTSLDDLVRATIGQALAIVCSSSAAEFTRERAAELVACLMHELADVNERDVTDVLAAATGVLAVGRHTARTLAAAAISLAPDHDRVVAGVSRLAAKAFERGHDNALCDLTILLLRSGTPCPEEWAARSVDHALVHRNAVRAACVLRAWLDCPLPADAPWLAAAVEHHGNRLLRQPLIRDEHLKALQIATPTVVGWLALLQRAEEIEHPPISATEFGANLDRARATLIQAMDATTAGGRVTLAAWLVQLVGDPTPGVEGASS
jgi:hypothetical protein